MAYWLLVYDGDCPMCRKFIQMIARFDHEKMIDSISFADYAEKTDKFSYDELEEDIHLIGKKGEVLKKGEAIHKMISILPPLKPFRWMLEGNPGRKFSDLFYFSTKRLRRCMNCPHDKREIRRDR